MTTFVLNSPVLTTYGTYTFEGPITPEKASSLLSDDFVSAIGHDATADLLSDIIGRKIVNQRIRIEMVPGDIAVVFRLLRRIPLGDISSRDELAEIDYELGLLERTA